MSIELDHVVIKVSDWARSRAFYEQVVGAEVVDHPEGRYALRFGDQQLNVHGPGIATGLVARLPVQPGNSDLAFRWAGMPEEALAHLEAHGVEPEGGLVGRSGVRGMGVSIYFRDPDGSLLEFISYARPATAEEIERGLAIQRRPADATPQGEGA